MSENDKPTLPNPFKPDSYYRVQLSEEVKFAGRTLSPGKQQTMQGALAETFRASIYSAEEVTDGDGS
jgi:hypothetical protein